MFEHFILVVPKCEYFRKYSYEYSCIFWKALPLELIYGSHLESNNTLLQTRWTYKQVHDSCPIYSKYIVYKSTTTD